MELLEDLNIWLIQGIWERVGRGHTACPNTSRELTMVTPYLERTRMCHICSSQLDPAVRCVLQNSCANGFSTLD